MDIVPRLRRRSGEHEGDPMTMIDPAAVPGQHDSEGEGLGRALNRVARLELAMPVAPPLLERPLVKAAVILTWTYGCLAVLVLADLPAVAATGFAVLLGLGVATGITSVGHEALHRPMLGSRRLDTLLGGLMGAPLGMSTTWWKAKHNVTHHGGPARGGRVGEGPVQLGPFARFAPAQRWHPWHRAQVVYVPLLLFPLQAVGMVGDNLLFATTGRVAGHQVAPRTVPATSRRLVGLALPLAAPVAVGVARHGAVATALVVAVVLGTAGTFVSLVLAVEVRQRGLAQVDAEPGLDGWTRWHLDVAMAIDAPAWVAWFTGGVHQHIEHHLFPRAPMHRLGELGPLVEAECERRGIAYHRYASYPASWRAFLVFLVEMGRRPSDPVGQG
jgi:linoleoyl-CoA desaturase